MPIILHTKMTDDEILYAIAMTYASEVSWTPGEKDYVHGDNTEREAFAFRDRGEYARQGLQIIEARQQIREGQAVS